MWAITGAVSDVTSFMWAITACMHAAQALRGRYSLYVSTHRQRQESKTGNENRELDEEPIIRTYNG